VGSLSAPEHLSEAARVVWCEVAALFKVAGDDVARVSGAGLEAYCVQVARMRDAQRRVDREGLVVADEKGRPVPHPALVIEKAAQVEVRAWQERFTPRRGNTTSPPARKPWR